MERRSIQESGSARGLRIAYSAIGYLQRETRFVAAPPYVLYGSKFSGDLNERIHVHRMYVVFYTITKYRCVVCVAFCFVVGLFFEGKKKNEMRCGHCNVTMFLKLKPYVLGKKKKNIAIQGKLSKVIWGLKSHAGVILEICCK